MSKSYPDVCLERAEKAAEGPWSFEVEADYEYILGKSFRPKRMINPTGSVIDSDEYVLDLLPGDAEFITHARQDVPELARRLKEACRLLKSAQKLLDAETGVEQNFFNSKADELEAMPEEEK